MRLPADAVLIVVNERGSAPGAEATVAALSTVWREERLPAIPVGEGSADVAGGGLEAALDAIGATTLVVCGGPAPDALAAARAAADLGYRVFLVGDPLAEDIGDSAEKVRIVTCETALAAGRGAKARQRWAEKRRRAGGED